MTSGDFQSKGADVMTEKKCSVHAGPAYEREVQPTLGLRVLWLAILFFAAANVLNYYMPLSAALISSASDCAQERLRVAQSRLEDTAPQLRWHDLQNAEKECSIMREAEIERAASRND